MSVSILLIGYKLSWDQERYPGKDIDDNIRDAVAHTSYAVTTLTENTSLDKVYNFNPYENKNKHTNITNVVAPDKNSGLDYLENSLFDFIQLPLFGLSQEKGTIQKIFKLLNSNGKLITFQDAHQSFVESELQNYTKSLEDISVEQMLEAKMIPQPNVNRVVYKKQIKFRI